MSIREREMTLAVDAAGGGTFLSDRPIEGEILSIRCGGTALGGTADFTFTRRADGGTVLAVTNGAAPWQYQPREASHTLTGGTTAYNAGVGPVGDMGVPIADYLKCVVAEGTPNASQTVQIYYRGH